MRLVEFSTKGVVSLISRYGLEKLRIPVEKIVTLPTNPVGEFYTFKNDTEVITFSVCEGEGTLNPLDYPKAYHFLSLDTNALEKYLLYAKLPTSLQQQELIQAFLKIYNSNIAKGKYYLSPPYFKYKEEKLLC